MLPSSLFPGNGRHSLYSSEAVSPPTTSTVRKAGAPLPDSRSPVWRSTFDEKLAGVIAKSLKTQQAVIREIVTTEPRLSEAAVITRLVQKLLKHASHFSLERREATVRQVLELDSTLDRSDVVAKLNQLALVELPAWVRADFWSREIDPILLTGLKNANQEFEAVLARIQSLCPAVLPSEIRQQHVRYRSGNRKTPGIPPVAGWPDKADCMLREAVALEIKAEREAIRRALQKHREVRPQAIEKRINILRKRLFDAHRSKPSSCSTETDTEPPDLSRKNGAPGRPSEGGRSWSGADLQYLLYHVNHQTVPNIAKALGRSCKSISRKLEDFGLSTAISKRSVGIYSLRDLRKSLHVHHSKLLRWIGEGKLQVAVTKRTVKRGRHRHVKEEGLLLFLENNLNELDLTRIEPDSDIKVLIDEILARQPADSNRRAANA